VYTNTHTHLLGSLLVLSARIPYTHTSTPLFITNTHAHVYLIWWNRLVLVCVYDFNVISVKWHLWYHYIGSQWILIQDSNILNCLYYTYTLPHWRKRVKCCYPCCCTEKYMIFHSLYCQSSLVAMLCAYFFNKHSTFFWVWHDRSAWQVWWWW
jgi:hypothetical protein